MLGRQKSERSVDEGGAACEVLEGSRHCQCRLCNEEPLKSNLPFTVTIDSGQMELRNKW